MAKASNTVKVTLQEGTELELRTLNIKLYRKFQDRWTQMVENSETEDNLDALIDLAVICVSREITAEQAEDRDWLEEALDFDTIYLILKVCAGVDLNPANVQAALKALDGQSSN